MKKIAIIGATASGKTTLANKLGEFFDIPVYNLDKIGWKENGVYASQSEIIDQVQKIITLQSWIIEGGMPRSKTLEMRLENADTIILFDLPILLCLWRQTKRYFKYFNKVRPDMGGNNKQKYPFTWKEIRYAINYPMKDIYFKLEPYLKSKKVIILKSIKDETYFINNLNHSSF